MTRPTTICRTIKVDIGNNDSGPYGIDTSQKPVPSSTASLDAYLEQLFPKRKVEFRSRPESVQLRKYGFMPNCVFFQAVHECFSQHYALTLRPEVLMHLIVGEVATTVNLHPEHYRNLFTRSAEKETVRVLHSGLRLGDPTSPWNEVLALFDSKLREVVPPGIMQHLLPEFTTATPESRCASLVAFMDAAQSFYEYRCGTLCGIPEVRLAGKPEDYARLLTAASQLSEAFNEHLGAYFQHLLPVLKTLASQAAGAPEDAQFWKSIYKYQSASGTNASSGWLTTFVNYLQRKDDEGATEIVAKSDDLYDWTALLGDDGWSRGIELDDIPSHVSSAPFIWEYFGQEIKMRFVAGPLAIENADDSVMPTLAYAVLHEEPTETPAAKE